MDRVDVLIAGGGASGTLAALHLVRSGGPASLVVADATGRHGRGVAYSTRERTHLLNVPAGRMSALPDRPGDFLDWLRGRALVSAHDFVPRWLWGTYLNDRLDRGLRQARGRVRLERLTAEVHDLGLAGSALRARVGDREIEARAVVLAVGHGPAAGPIPTPWEPGAIDAVDPGQDVLLLGTGLTMVDAVLALEQRGHRGTLTAVSRHGLLPHVHANVAPVAVELSSSTARGLLRELRDRVERERGTGAPWQAVVDGVRPQLQAVWRGLETSERRRFLRHAVRRWEVHRHRMPSSSAAALARLEGQGRLRIVRGRPQVDVLPSGVLVRGAGPELRADRALDCTGPRSPLVNGLVARLIERGLARPDELGLGIDALPGGEVLGARGEAVPGLFALGPPLRGVLWETTAIPEIRAQAARLARTLLAGETHSTSSPTASMSASALLRVTTPGRIL